jgi:hypothetical protein
MKERERAKERRNEGTQNVAFLAHINKREKAYASMAIVPRGKIFLLLLSKRQFFSPFFFLSLSLDS